MDKKQFNFEVKEKSIEEFFKIFLPDLDNKNNSDFTIKNNYSQHFLNNQDIYIKKSDIITLGNKVIFEFEDEFLKTRNKCITQHTYVVKEYDDFLNLLVHEDTQLIQI